MWRRGISLTVRTLYYAVYGLGYGWGMITRDLHRASIILSAVCIGGLAATFGLLFVSPQSSTDTANIPIPTQQIVVAAGGSSHSIQYRQSGVDEWTQVYGCATIDASGNIQVGSDCEEDITTSSDQEDDCILMGSQDTVIYNNICLDSGSVSIRYNYLHDQDND